MKQSVIHFEFRDMKGSSGPIAWTRFTGFVDRAEGSNCLSPIELAKSKLYVTQNSGDALSQLFVIKKNGGMIHPSCNRIQVSGQRTKSRLVNW